MRHRFLLIIVVTLVPVTAATFGITQAATPAARPEIAPVGTDPYGTAPTESTPDSVPTSEPADAMVTQIFEAAEATVPEPDDAAVPTSVAPNVIPEAASAAVFSAEAFFGALFSTDLDEVARISWSTAPGSPAGAYVAYQHAHLVAASTAGVDVPAPNVSADDELAKVCVPGGACSTISDIELTDDDLLVSFSVDGRPIAPRLGQPTAPIAVGNAQVRLAGAYVTGSTMLAYVEVPVNTGETFGFASAVYVAADGTQTAVDLGDSLGAEDTPMVAGDTVMLSFPDAEPGGELRVIVYPAGGTPLAAILPIAPLP